MSFCITIWKREHAYKFTRWCDPPGEKHRQRYKDEAVKLDNGKRLVESDLATTWSAYGGLKEALLKSEIARSTVEEAEKKAREDLEAERACSHGLSDDVDRLKKALREKEDAIL